MATSEVSIANSALDLIGGLSIVSLDDDTEEAILCKRNLPLVRDKILRSYNWKFATKRVQLAPETDAPVFGFTYAFPVPTDNLKIIGQYDPDYPKNYYTADDCPFVVEGNKILSDLNPFQLFYISQVTDPNQFDPIFSELLSIDLAVKIGYALTSGQQRVQGLTIERERVLQDARTADSFEGIPADRETEDWLGRRHGAYYGRGRGLYWG